MDVSKFDYVEFKKYKGINDGGLKAISDCITCDYPSLRHFNMPKPKNQEVHSGILAPIRQGPSPTAAPSTSPSLRASSSPSRISSNRPTLETASPTNGPTNNPTNGPTNNPTNGPTNNPTNGPTDGPTKSPTDGPTKSPTDGPTKSPTNSPTDGPTNSPTNSPTVEPTVAETLDPTNSPTLATSNSPTAVSTTQSPTTSLLYTGGSPSGANSPSSPSETSPSTDSNTGGNSPASSPTAVNQSNPSETSPSDSNTAGNEPASSPTAGNPSSPSATSPSTDPNTGGNSPASSPTAVNPSSPSETSPSTDSNTGGNSPASSPTAGNPSAASPSDSNTAGNEPASSPTAGNPSSPSATSPSTDSNTAGNEPASSPTAGNPSSPSGPSSPSSPSVASPSTDPDTDPVVCISNSEGDFSISSLESGTRHYIDYSYRLETIKGKASITQEILPVMEKNLLDAILPSVFRDSCINSRRLMERDTHNRRRLSMIGASAKPDDTISTDGVCGSENTKLDCNIIDGRMTMISDSETFNSTEFDNLICDVLNDGSLEIGHPAVKHIRCIPMKVGTILDIDDTTSDKSKTPTIEPVTESLNSISYLVSFAAAAFVILGIYGYRRRHSKKDEVDHLDDSDLVNMEQSLSFENGLGSTAMDFTPIVNPSFSAGGIEVLARNSYFPETIEESEDEDDEHLDEVSLNDLNMTTTSEYYNNSWRNDSS